MSLADASLTDLVAELRERLRSFMATPLGEAPDQPQPGPLSPAGRAALAARLLSVMLGDRQGDDAAAAAAAFAELADALQTIPAALPGSALEAGLRRLAGEFENLALAWESGEARDLANAWRSLRNKGDQLWPPAAAEASVAPTPEAAPSPAMPAVEPPAPPGRRAVWLLVAGDVRRATLRRRLEAAGLTVVCLTDADTAVRRLATEQPTAVICDDAEPTRFGSRLGRLLPASSPPVVLVHGRPVSQPAAGRHVWLPPFRTGDLLDQLARSTDPAP